MPYDIRFLRHLLLSSLLSLPLRWPFLCPTGNPVTSFEGLQKILGPKFDLVKTIDMPFFIRETRRKNQWSVSHCTIWRLK